MRMTREQAYRFWDAARRHRVRGPQRLGQSLMNALREVEPELYAEVSGTEADCFYRDDLVPAFRARVGL